ncbi:MAG: peptidylprolyl isomerase [Campylobacteraceae bacterium]|nr:peptidylprolyl isomerase [Campylobacteraceae bacterium]
MRKLLLAIVLCVFVANAQETVILETNSGNITIKLYPKVAPMAYENFTTLVKNGYYDNVTFHRVIKNFMIQGGDPTGTGMGGASIWGRPFPDEFSPYMLFEKPYLLAMANAGKNTNGSQFFITTAPTPWLNGYHTIFGEVIDGFDTVKAIENSATDKTDKPIEPQVIIKAYIKTN